MQQKRWLMIVLLMISVDAIAQQPDTLIKKLDSVTRKVDSSGGQTNVIKQEAYNENTRINFPTYFVLLASDVKQQFTKPFHMTPRDWGNFGKFAVVTGAIMLAEQNIQRFAVDLRDHNKAVISTSQYVTNAGGTYEGYTLVLLAAYGIIFKHEKIKTTTLLASQAYITSGLIEGVVKVLAGRQRPSYYVEGQVNPVPRFNGPFHSTYHDRAGHTISSSFPSGHTAAAFAAATVFAMEYRDRPLVKIGAYTAASLIGLSRITENKHWASDVFVGAGLGYICGKQVVDNYHRYARIKNQEKRKKGTVAFSINYQFDHVMPEVIYTFR
jgi:membrane-associated phospholipid phosphatase